VKIVTKILLFAAALSGLSLLPSCTVGPTDVESFESIEVRGQLLDNDGNKPARGVSVVMRPYDYVPHPWPNSNDTGVDSTISDEEGKFVFDSVKEGTYSIVGSKDTSLFVLIDSVKVSDTGAILLPPDTLKPPAAITYGGRNDWKHDAAGIYVAAIGVGRYAPVNKDGSFTFDRLPEGDIRLQVINNLGETLSNRILIETTAGKTDPVDSLISFYTLATAVAPSAGGIVTYSNKAMYYQGGDTVRVTARAAEGYRFGGWSGDTASGDTTLVITVKRNLSIGVRFVKQYKLTLSGSTRGSVNPAGMVVVDSGASTHILATANSGYIFSAWHVVSGSAVFDDSSADTASVRLMQGDASVTGNFKIKTFMRTLGKASSDTKCAVQQTSDGGYIIGKTYSSGESRDVFLIKADASGTTTWTQIFGGAGDDEGYSVQQTIDGGYIATGFTTTIAGYRDVYLIKIKTDASGTATWTKTFGGAGDDDEGYSVQQTSDGGYIVAGFTNSSASLHDVYLIKTDASGTATWTKTFGGPYNDEGYSVQQTSDGGYIITGFTTSIAGGRDVYLIKTDAMGTATWIKTLGGPFQDEGYSVRQTSDGGYIITGLTSSTTSAGDVYLIKTDASGTVAWTQTFGGADFDDEGYCVQQTGDGGYVVTGFTSSTTGARDACLIKTDASGTATWIKTYGGADNDMGYSVQQTSDGGYIITGNTYYPVDRRYEIFLIKTDENGDVAK
jgi:hypothetical protein